ncbi:MAG: glucokinase [Chloroflexi bacterium]|nr:glucokinase [Chloroflexota bacterium]
MLLLADVGGTKTALAVVDPARDLHRHLTELQVQSADFGSFNDMLEFVLAKVSYPIEYLAMGVPGPVADERVVGTNLPWEVDSRKVRARFGFKGVTLLNDLEAISSAIPLLTEHDVIALNDVPPKAGGSIAVVAPGTGLGEGYLTWDGKRYRAHPSEGGHANFGPDSHLQYELANWLWARYGHVSNERVCSGRGMPNLYQFLKEEKQMPEPAWLSQALLGVDDPTPIIVQEAMRPEGADPLCRATLELFVEILGAEAGDLALSLLATGGVYLAGGIPPRIVSELQRGGFMQAFRAKGRVQYVMEDIPVYVVLDPRIALLGVASRALETMTMDDQ